MKKCPFCKNEIESNKIECPICKMVLIEKVEIKKPKQSYTYSSPHKSIKYNSHYFITRIKNFFKKLKIPVGGRGIVISIVGSLLLTVVLNYRGSSNPLPSPIQSTPEEITTSSSTIPTSVTPKIPYSYLPNGTVLFSNMFSFNGEGVLTISNGSGSDAIVKLITSSGKKVYSVYVRANNSYSIKKIDDGTYRVLFSFGSDWDSNQNNFLVNPSAEAFNDIFDFKTTNDNYMGYKITLNPVIDGTAKTNPIDPSEFDRY